MIREWRLRRFKSVKRDTTLRLAPLTVLTGPNSSGKSSLLQSILLIQQTLSSKVSRRHLILNGDVIKLGTFADVISEGVAEDDFTVSFALEVDLSEAAGRRRSQTSPYYYAHLYRFHEGEQGRFELSLTFGAAAIGDEKGTLKTSNLQVELREGTYSVAVYNGPTEGGSTRRFDASVPTLEIKRRSSFEIQRLLDGVESQMPTGKSPDEQALRYSVNEAFASQEFNRTIYRSMRHYRTERMEPVAVQLDHFLPALMVNRYATAQRKLREAFGEMLEEIGELFAFADDARSNPYEKALLAVLQERAAAEKTDIQTFLRRSRAESRRPVAEEELLESIISAAMQRLGDREKSARSLEYTPSPEAMQVLSAVISQEFSVLRYLGPLRDEPKPVYSIANSGDPTHLGFRGEFTAGVLDLYSSQTVDFVHPNEPEIVRRASLSEAVNAWLSYLDIAESHFTKEEGKLGHRLFIRPGGIEKSLDLTNVGVGVSQILPIIVMALISEPGSVLLFEQPELHLHPKVQLRLADFFLGVIKTGRQCIVETHSEYLINRLRLRIAEREDNGKIAGSMALYFVERRNGASEFHEVVIDEYGAIPDWPDGFFDQGPSESDKILIAAQRKRTAHLKRRTSSGATEVK